MATEPQIAGTVAHDLNNLLSVIMTYTLLLMEGLEADDPALADLEEVRVAAEKVVALVRGVLDAVTPRRGSPESASNAHPA